MYGVVVKSIFDLDDGWEGTYSKVVNELIQFKTEQELITWLMNNHNLKYGQKDVLSVIKYEELKVETNLVIHLK